MATKYQSWRDDESLSDAIHSLVSMAKPTDAEVAQVVAGWDAWFYINGIDSEAAQRDEFSRVMCDRVQCLSVSVIAPFQAAVRP